MPTIRQRGEVSRMKNRKQLFLVVCMFFVMVLISSNERASCEVLDSSKGMASLNTIGNVPFIKNTTQNNTLLSEKKKWRLRIFWIHFRPMP